MNALFYDQWRLRAPDDDGPDGGDEDPEPLCTSGLGVRHALEAHLATGAGINVSCWECDAICWVVARLPPRHFRCPQCQEMP